MSPNADSDLTDDESGSSGGLSIDLSDLWSGLSSIVTWLSDIFDYVKSICSSLAGLVSDFGDFVTDLPNIIINALKSLFIPEDGYIEDCVETIKNNFLITFGIDEFDISSSLGSETALSDIDIDYNAGVSYSGTIVNMNYVVSALSTFRPYIRGFLVLLMWLYSINQFLGLIGQPGLAVGVGVLLGRSKESEGD